MRQCLILGMLLTAIGCASAPTTTSSFSAESDRAADDRSLRARSLDGPVDERPDGAALRARAGLRPRRHARRIRCRALRARRRHAGRSGVRRAVRRFQLDGLSGERRLRRVLDGRDRVRTLDAADGHERSLQSRAQSAERVRAEPDSCAVRADLPERGDDDRLGLERHRRRDGLRARPPSRRSRQHGGLVARRSARRRLRRAASRSGPEAGAAGAGVQPHRRRESARSACRGCRLQHAVA